MSLVQMPAPERRPSPGFTVGLSSNNPFRNHALAPASHSRLPPPEDSVRPIPSSAPERPVSRNPFLDHTEIREGSSLAQRSSSPQKDMFRNSRKLSSANQELGGNAIDLFNNLTLNLDPPGNGAHQSAEPSSAPPVKNGLSRTEHGPLPPAIVAIHPAHRPSRSQEAEYQRSGNSGLPRLKPRGPDIFADPPESEKHRRPRRNSESSVADRSSKVLDPEDERRRRERRYRDREARHRGEVRRPQTAKARRPNQRLDIIDQLDVTSIYGTGLFHHDGPFDACNPHRNRKGATRAPMQAFPKDSANNALGGSGPVNKSIDFAQFHGRGAEGFTDYSTSGTAPAQSEPGALDAYAGSGGLFKSRPGSRPGVDRMPSFNATSKVEPVHGDESMGLGTSTFLEGTPASRTAIERVEIESDQNMQQSNSGGLGRKKSLVQKIKGISTANRSAGAAGRVTSPDVLYGRTISPTNSNDGHPLSAGGTRKLKETNPFFNDYDDAYEKKGTMIRIADGKNRIEGNATGERPLTSPKRRGANGMMERRATNDGTGMVNGESKSGGGFLARVKSLKGGRRAKPEARE